LIAALLSPSLATLTSWDSPSTWIRLPMECFVLCLALYAYRWRFCRSFFWLAAAFVPLGLFTRVFFGSPITAGVLSSIEATNAHETWELLRTYPGSAILGAAYLAAVSAGAAIAFKSPNPFTSRRLSAGLLVCALAVPFAAVPWLRAEPPADYGPMTLGKNLEYILLNQSFPFDLAYSEYAVERGRRAVGDAKALRESFVFPGVKRLTTDDGPETYVVIIGESSRRESWSLFGYGRDTNPRLRSLAGRGLFLFDRVRSNANITIFSLPLALTGTAPAEHERANEEKSIVGLARQAGFDTYWISAQERYGGAANPITAIADEAGHEDFIEASARKAEGFHDFSGAYDEDVLKPFKEAAAGGSRKKVIFIHTMGSHADYMTRVPEEREVFDKAAARGGRSGAESGRRALVDDYDDSILYTDYVIKSVVDVLAGLDHPSAVLYFSDHGERMYCGAHPRESFAHGFLPPAKDELDVPMLLWLSRAYRARYPVLARAARANAHLETSLVSVFDTFADLIRVKLSRNAGSASLLARSPLPASLDVFGIDGSVRPRGMPERICGWEQP
jgi:glucan phosphoethanolaminetransferase (alkaline phosphatase superfamily)